MTRQVITLDKIRKCHVVESGDAAGYFTYEVETEYEAGTLVFDSENNMFWCSIVHIEAPDKWAFVPFIYS